MTAWPISPAPQRDESLIPWFTRVGRQYGLAPCELLDAVERTRAHPLALVCPQCWVDDIDGEREPYGRQGWQQVWYTVCELHGFPMVRSKLVQI
jgi:hypothetical protein